QETQQKGYQSCGVLPQSRAAERASGHGIGDLLNRASNLNGLRTANKRHRSVQVQRNGGVLDLERRTDLLGSLQKTVRNSVKRFLIGRFLPFLHPSHPAAPSRVRK